MKRTRDPAPLTVRFLGVLLSDEHIAFQTTFSDSGSTFRGVSLFGYKTYFLETTVEKNADMSVAMWTSEWRLQTAS
jgi:hypothetical protein